MAKRTTQQKPFWVASFAALLCSSLFTPQAFANPEGGTVVSGAATIVETGPKLDIHQTTDRALIDWRSFDIAPGEHTEFHQPASTSVTVNRILDTSPSNIAGQLSANGNLVLINPNGIMFGDTATVDVNGLLATSADITNADFNAGNLDFSIHGKSDAAIQNFGTITAAEAGLVGLVAPQVENHGVIQANLGRVQLSSADTVSLDFYGDGLLHVAVTDDALSEQIVKNTGTIETNGGSIALTAATARSVIDSLIQVEGELTAPVVEQQGGKIVIRNDSAEGTTLVAGQLNSAGGDIEVTGSKVGLMAGGKIDVSAADGGGDVRFGGDWQGSGTTQRAQMAYVDEDAQILANATDNGDGGQVVVWADDTTRFYGDIQSKGGINGGNGGQVEVSGKEYLDFRGTVSTLAPMGEAGSLLLDPTDIVISNGGNQNVTGASPFEPNLDDGPSVLNIATLVAALGGGDVTVQTLATGTQLGDITVSDALTWTTAAELTLSAHNDVYVNAAISGRDALRISAREVHINAAITESGGQLMTTVFTPNDDSLSVGIAGGVGDFNLSVAELDLINLTNGSLIGIGSTSATNTMDVQAYNWNVPLSLRSGYGEMQINGTLNVGANDLSLRTYNLDINADIIGSGTVRLGPNSNVSVGIAGAPGDFQLSTTELDHIVDGWDLINFETSGNEVKTVGAYTWRDAVRFENGNGLLDIQGTQNFGTNDLTLRANDINIAADLIGSGDLRILPRNSNYTIGVAGAAADVEISTTELDHILDGWNNIFIGISGDGMDLIANAYTWRDDVTFRTTTGLLDIQGDQNLGGNNITLLTENLGLNANIIGGGGTATITADDSNVAMSLMGGTGGTLQVTSADIDKFTGSWDTLRFGNTDLNANLTIGAATWNHNIEVQTALGQIIFEGAQNFGTNNLTVASNADVEINALLNGTGELTFLQPTGWRTIGLAGSGGDLSLSVADLDNIATGWNLVSFGSDSASGSVSTDAYTWRWDTLFQSLSGNIVVNQPLDFQTYDVTIRTDGRFVNSDTITGTGNFIFEKQTASNTMTVNDGGADFSFGSFNNFADGWNSLTFGRADMTGDIDVDVYANWRDPVRFLTTGDININGDIAAAGDGAFDFSGDAILAGNTNITTAAGDITFNGSLDAGNFNLTLDAGTGDITFNAITQMNDLNLDGADLTFNNAFSANTIYADMTGTLNLDAQLTATAAGDALVLSGNNYVNTVGANVLQTPSGRWLVYTAAPAGNTRNGLLPDASEFNKTLAANAPATIGAGNRFIYSTAVAPTLTYRVNNGTTPFSTAYSAFGITYQSGLLAGDTLANIGLTGSPTYANSYTQGSPVPATPIVGALTATTGTLSSVLGYDFTFQAGNLTVETQPSLPTTVTAVSQVPEMQIIQPFGSQSMLEGDEAFDTSETNNTVQSVSLISEGSPAYIGKVRMSPELVQYLRPGLLSGE